MRSLEQWLAYQTQVHPQAIDLGLDRLRLVLDRLGWRQPKVPVITIAGTNGKGSVSGYCATILAAAGYRAGTFTSPHLRDYRERIRVHDRLVSAAELVSAFERIEAARGEVGLTFFEFNTLAALLVFEAARLDAWVLEIGMGGRLDAVNVVDPDAAVVVSIGFDHQEYLGATIEAIAREKAGIFRQGRPAVLGSRDMPGIVEEIARGIGAPLKRLGKEYIYIREGATWHFRGSRWNLPHLPAPALVGDMQYANAATAIAALEELDARLTIPAAAVAQGLAGVQLAARFQVIAPAEANAPTWILDVAHNPAAARVLARNLRDLKTSGRTLAVCGILADKDASSVVTELRGSVDAWWCVTTEGDRGRSGASLAQMVESQVAAPVEAADSTAAGCATALEAAKASDRILVFGSFHVVGPALDWLEARGLLPPAALPEYTATPRATHVQG
ncbi:MAG TPA: bifunctional tetrahydrofolate synthase/dihydrofolate synthase [Steroidobacteraceae bacterium]|nr:bifunctional tetrahydrofolate synthase/dihydrofolate synthase [Steroidobacteraceae bacterium]